MAEQKQEHPEGTDHVAAIVEARGPLSPRPVLSINTAEDKSKNTSPDLPSNKQSSNFNIAVTPGIHQATYDSPATQRPNGADSPGYFTQDPRAHDRPSKPNHENEAEASDKARAPSSPTDLIRGAMSGEEVLRRISLAAIGRSNSLADIKEAAHDLALTGNIISATFTTPYTIKHHKNGEWELGNRHGLSALTDAFVYLSSDEVPWNHSVVAWTGEIEAVSDSIGTPATPQDTTTLPRLSQLSAPVPIEGDLPPTPPNTDGLWISRDRQRELEDQLAQDKRLRAIPVWLSDDDEADEDGITLNDQSRWRRYAEHALYPLFHYKQQEPSDGRAERIEWANYYRANLQFANKIIEIYKPGDIVVIHDYYLLLLPSMLRQRMPNMYMSFFLHCPFPSSEFLRCIPRRRELLEGLMGANLIGFQSYSYSRHFTSCCTRILDFPSDATGVDSFGARVEVGVYPIGIDTRRVEKLAWSEQVSRKCDALKELYKGKKIIVGRDRLDSVRGVTQKLMAFDRFLEMYPEWREKVVLIQVTSPTSIMEVKDEAENKIAGKVNELVMKINGTFGSLGFSPVQHYPQYLAPDEYFALLRAADIGLITSVRDGMNTTSLEYVVCQRDTHGPVILSEFSGTAGSLRDAIHINPWDLTNVAREINNALTMSPEKRQAMQSNLYAHVTTQTVQSWIKKFLRKLVGTLASNRNEHSTPVLDRTILLEQYRAAKKRLFMFDYDGTLTPIVREPQAAIPSERVIQTLRTLAADHRNAVWIISGRDQDFLQKHLGHISELGFSAEHGSFIRYPGSTAWENLAEKLDMSWQPEVLEVFQNYTDRVLGSFIERKRCALTWHYRQADPEQGVHASNAALVELRSTVAKKWDVEVMEGKANLEVRPTFINKGEIVKRLVHHYNSGPIDQADKDQTEQHSNGTESSKLEFLLCCGDDFTDEDMFRALNGLSGTQVDGDHVFTVSVGARNKVTLAKWHVLEPRDVLESTALLVGVGLSGGITDKLSQVNLAAMAGLEGRVPT
ncbi:putative glycosyltransferase family 20 protein [Rosellinia necatrix]|uniref:Putative glycosyltransferase family 20 protein n=1 Tax=Rosellinia necatrix TaxID=77044 RepID=A0A1S7UPL6_ROSNE|nr:putative glycosyltransferase family 20 protein [Rosellinia necatrix]